MKTLRVFGGLSLLFVIGLYFKTQYMFGAAALMILGAFFFIAFFLPMSFIQERKKGEKLGYLIIKLFVLELVTIGAIFKFQHWPGAGTLSLISTWVWIIVFVPLFIYRQVKRDPDPVSKTNNIIYFILLNAFVLYLAVGGRTSNIASFAEIETGIVDNTNKTIRKNELILKTLESIEISKKDSLIISAMKVHAGADSLNLYISKLRSKLIASVEGISESLADSVGNSDIRRNTAVDIPTLMLIGDPENPDTGKFTGYDLKKQIRNYFAELERLPNEADRNFFKEGLTLNTEDIMWMEDDAEHSQTWESFYFYRVPLSAVLNKLENLKYDLRLSENQGLQYLLNKAYTSNTLGVSSKINEMVDKQEKEQSKKEMELLKREKEQYNTKMLEKNETVEDQSRTLVIIVFVVIGAICLLIITINTNRERRKANQLLAKQKEYIEHQKQEITDSINYSKRIQSSILPRVEEINAAFPQSFVLYKPKDIVSGDFYWFTENENGYLIAAADCTGHGVPGAIMSVISSEKLTEASLLSSNVSEILFRTNLGIKKTLRQSDKQDSTRDGMDIALCLFDKELKTVTYAGANRALWLIRKGTSEITEIKPTKSAIGGLTKDTQQFESNSLSLNKGDTIYLFTDGYADQFSPQDKKMMTRKFKETILAIQHLSMEEQEKHLEEFHKNWKGNMEQTDDVLVIGIRV